jgi:hypothetical protein
MENDILDDASLRTKIIVSIKIIIIFEISAFFMTMDDTNGLHGAQNVISYDQ